MLHFENVSKSFLFKGRMMPVVLNATFTAHFEENFGLIVPPRSGASTFQNLIMNAEQPDTGKIYRYGKISWPVGGVQGLIPALTGTENCRYIAMIYQLDPDEILAFVIDMARIGHYMDMPVRTYSSTLQSRVALALLLALDFDMYLIMGGTSLGDPEFAERAGPLMREKLNSTPLFFVSPQLAGIRKHCDRFAVLDDCVIYNFDSAEEVEHFMKKEAVSHG